MIKQLKHGIFLLPVMAFAAEHVDKNWTGKYIGGNVGGIFNRATLNASHTAFSSWDGQCNQKGSLSSPFMGGQLGIQKAYDSKLILGFEGDYTINFNQSSNLQCDCVTDASVYDRFNWRNQYQASIKGRLGYAYQHNLLPFFAAGVSFANLGLSYSNEAMNTYSHTQIRPGYVVGGGVDWGFSDKWNLRLEYYYNQYNALNLNIPYVYEIFDSGANGRLNVSSNNIRAAVNYWF